MSRNWTGVCALFVLLAAGCQQNVQPEALAVAPVAAAPKFTTVTLSAEQLMSLDWTGRAAGRAVIVDKRPVGAGVEFDIRFPGAAAGVCSFDYTSSGAVGQGALAGRDVRSYQAFALKFTLIAVDGQSDPNLPLELAVGSVIGPAGDGKVSAYEPVVLGLAPEHATKIAKTPMHTSKIRVIGIHAHVANPKIWDTAGGVVTLRVEPAADAEVLPWSAPAAEVRPGAATSRPVGDRSRTTTAETPTNTTSKPRGKSPSRPALGIKRVGAW
jgi:hypothetical protein